jgi:SnoaL-like domain
VITMHQVHHPEIELTGAGTARATWMLEDYVISLPGDWSIHGTALYHDEYVKIAGEWKIRHTGYQRIFSERWARSDIKSLKVTESMHTPPPK